jgi:predicted nucleic acid-binding protein
VIYYDTSALVSLITGRAPASELRAYLRERKVPGATSTVGLIETVRTCDAYGTFPNLMTRLLRDFDEIDVTAEVRDRAAVLPRGLRTLDAIHVATAELLGSELSVLLTYDKRMVEIAKGRGLPVASPGMTL